MNITDLAIKELENATEAELISIAKNGVDVQNYGYHPEDDIAVALEREFQNIAEEILQSRGFAIP